MKKKSLFFQKWCPREAGFARERDAGQTYAEHMKSIFTVWLAIPSYYLFQDFERAQILFIIHGALDAKEQIGKDRN